eukprot:5094358-Amphidinium_carterae.2
MGWTNSCAKANEERLRRCVGRAEAVCTVRNRTPWPALEQMKWMGVSREHSAPDEAAAPNVQDSRMPQDS